MNARNTANARWIARASVSLRMPKPNDERQRRRVPDLEQRPRRRDDREHDADRTGGLAPAEVGLLDELVELDR